MTTITEAKMISISAKLDWENILSEEGRVNDSVALSNVGFFHIFENSGVLECLAVQTDEGDCLWFAKPELEASIREATIKIGHHVGLDTSLVRIVLSLALPNIVRTDGPVAGVILEDEFEIRLFDPTLDEADEIEAKRQSLTNALLIHETCLRGIAYIELPSTNSDSAVVESILSREPLIN